MDQLPVPAPGEFLFYESEEGTLKVQVIYQDETVWLTQRRMAELFGVEIQTINYHLKGIFESAELQEDRTIRKFRIVQLEGKREVSREVEAYNLDAIIAVGYRVNSFQATRFRQWATRTLREFLVKGFVLDDARLKQGGNFGKDYFEELLARIRDIRASERRFYQKITDIYQQCSIDYDPQSPITQTFFATVQNKLEWAITGMTAAELIKSRADAQKPNMGLTTWKNSPNGKIRKGDVSVAKNYLSEEELRQLNRIVTMYLDFAENQAERQITMRMQDWAERLDAFLQFNGYAVLENAGRISAQVAKELAEAQYEQFKLVQDQRYESDFDKVTRRLEAAKPPKAPTKKRTPPTTTKNDA